VGALLKHRCLLNTLDYGEEEGISYLVTEYFPSVTLEELADKGGKLPLAEALYILGEAAEGLEALHEARDIEAKKKLGLVHRDISPHNILIGLDGRVKIIDYGIIKRKDPTEKTRAGIVKGKLRYMAPEQACGGPVSPASDLYSLGVVFMRCVTGGRPHGRGKTAEILARARQGLDWEAAARKAKVPKPVKKILARLMAVDGAQRYESAGLLVKQSRKALSTLFAGYEVHAFRRWVEQHARVKKAGRKPQSRKKKQKEGAPAPAVPWQNAPGIHPKWAFFGLAVLWLVALIAHLVNVIFLE